MNSGLERPGSAAGPRRGLIPLLGVAAALYLGFLGAYPLLDPDEGRYAEISREMVESGDRVTPRLNYVPYLEKPPLFYWLQAGSLTVFGQNEWGARLPAALAGLGTLLLVVLFGSRFLGPSAGLLAGWVHLTALLPLILARYAILDGLFTFTLLACWFAWWSGRSEERLPTKRRWYLLAWLCLALAALTKGIAALVLTALIVGAMLLLRREGRDRREIGSMLWWPGPLLFLLLLLPWHVVMELRNPGFLHFYVVVQHFGRLVQSEHARPFWFFPVLLPVALLPWSVLLFPALAEAFRRAFRRPTILFLLVCAASVVLLFSASRSKIPPYILPALPPLALLVGSFLDRAREASRSLRVFTLVQLFLTSALFAGLAWGLRVQDAAPPEAMKVILMLAAGGSVLAIAALGAAAWRPRLLPLATGLLLVLLLPTIVAGVAVISAYSRVGRLVKALPAPLPADLRVAEYNNYDRSLGFYTGRRIVLIDEVGELARGKEASEGEGWFLDDMDSLRELAEGGPLLAVVELPDWPSIEEWGLLRPVAANTTNLMLGNEAFFQATGLAPWPEHALEDERPLLLPRSAAAP